MSINLTEDYAPSQISQNVSQATHEGQGGHGVNQVDPHAGRRLLRPTSDGICAWPNCGAQLGQFPSLPTVKEHFRLNHAAVGPYQVTCEWPECGIEIRAENLGKHVAVSHFHASVRKCDLCDEWFSTKNSLDRHIEESRCWVLKKYTEILAEERRNGKI